MEKAASDDGHHPGAGQGHKKYWENLSERMYASDMSDGVRVPPDTIRSFCTKKLANDKKAEEAAKKADKEATRKRKEAIKEANKEKKDPAMNSSSRQKRQK